MDNRIPQPSSRQAGFTLMEVLITAIILSVGLLGLAGLQFNALRSNQSAAQSTLAVLRVIDGADRLRSNTAGVADGSYDNLTGDPDDDPGCINDDQGCGSEALAKYDHWSWSQQNAALPDGQGVICLDSTPNDGTSKEEHGCEGEGTNIFAVKIWWDDDRNPETALRRHTMSLIP
ncbi:MAG: type IV pilus modification protein PilV [Candidatus Polarisedimenticolaceae bacterium]|nr:type IV pilus modification protein PilV [Candidatus Polarisedimenticolaceae bacterium]